MSLSRFHIILLAVISIASIPSTRVASAEPRNIIIVLVDDLGWMDLGCQGSDFYQTPHIDQLAARGIRFINGYAACAVCSPTRAALMTGKDPARLGITDWIRAEFQLSGRQRPNCDVEGYHDANLKVLTPVNNSFLPHNEVTIAELLKQRGFVSCFIGKWHLGGEGYLPTDQGFDLNFGGWDYEEMERDQDGDLSTTQFAAAGLSATQADGLQRHLSDQPRGLRSAARRPRTTQAQRRGLLLRAGDLAGAGFRFPLRLFGALAHGNYPGATRPRAPGRDYHHPAQCALRDPDQGRGDPRGRESSRAAACG